MTIEEQPKYIDIGQKNMVVQIYNMQLFQACKPLHSKQTLQECYKDILQLKKITSDSVTQVIDSHYPIHEQPFPQLEIESFKPKLHAQFYEELFVPSPELMNSYQNTYTQSMQSKVKPSELLNSKLQSLYPIGSTNPTNQVEIAPSFSKVDAANIWVRVEYKEENMLKKLRQGKIDGTLANMEGTLSHQLQRLGEKNVNLENLLPLGDLRAKREQIMRNYAKDQ